jgi:hypothetical protein
MVYVSGSLYCTDHHLLSPIGIYRDEANGIKGACGPLLIHTEKGKTKAKEAEERQRQREGETPQEQTVAKRFKQGLESLPEVKVASTFSGSMTQEVFYLYAQHFIESLAPGSGPVILLLDGHASRWTVQALRLLMENDVYPFFIASHTSIWGQPNDCGINKRFHWALEQTARAERRDGDATVEYFNEIFCTGWLRFLEEERAELRILGYNTTTNAYYRTGMHPFNPFCEEWIRAIETLGLKNDDERDKLVMFEVVPKEDRNGQYATPVLTASEKLTMREGLNILPENDLGDHSAAIIRAVEIMKKWRKAIQNAVSEGESYEDYSKAYSPMNEVKTESEKLAMKYVAFELVDISKVQLSVKLTRSEKERQHTEDIIASTKIAEAIQLTCSIPAGASDQPTEKPIPGSATKTSETTWSVFLSNRVHFQVEEKDLLDPKQFFIERRVFQAVSKEQKRKQDQKRIRMAKKEQVELEKDLIKKAREKRKKADWLEYELLFQTIAARIKAGITTTYSFQEFEQLATRIRAPFKTEVDGYMVNVTEQDAAIMMDELALDAIKKKLLGGREKRRQQAETRNNEPNKRQRTGGNQAVNTAFGETGPGALHSTSGRDTGQCKKAREQKIRGLGTERKAIETTLRHLKEKKARCELATQRAARLCEQKRRQQEKQRQEQEQTTETTHLQQQQQQQDNQPVTPVEQWWEVRPNSSGPDLNLVLRMFDPSCGLLSKRNELKWNHIATKILPKLTEAGVTAKSEEYDRRLREIATELEDLSNNEEDVEQDTADVNQDADGSTVVNT